MIALPLQTRAGVQIKGGGATFPAQIFARWITEYQKLHPDVKIDYIASGSGAGIKAITARELDFICTDAPMSHKEMQRAGGEDLLVEVPAVAGAVVVSFNIPGFVGDLRLDGPTLAEIYLGRLKKWNDLRIIELNPGATLPDLPVITIHRSESSGTNFIFTHYLCTQSDAFDNRVGPSKLVKWPVGIGAEGNDGVIDKVAATEGGIGYVDLTMALEKNVPFAVLKNRDGRFVKASAQAVSAAGEAASAATSGDIVAESIWDQHGPDTYPIASFTYLVIRKDLGELHDPAKAKALADFLSWATTDGQALAPKLQYAPLGPAARRAAKTALSHLRWPGKAADTATTRPTSQPHL